MILCCSWLVLNLTFRGCSAAYCYIVPVVMSCLLCLEMFEQVLELYRLDLVALSSIGFVLGEPRLGVRWKWVVGGCGSMIERLQQQFLVAHCKEVDQVLKVHLHRIWLLTLLLGLLGVSFFIGYYCPYYSFLQYWLALVASLGSFVGV